MSMSTSYLNNRSQSDNPNNLGGEFLIKLNQPNSLRDNSIKKPALISSEQTIGSSEKAYDKNYKGINSNRPLTSVLEEGIVFEDNEEDISGEFGYNKNG